jgi:hypothetical protein
MCRLEGPCTYDPTAWSRSSASTGPTTAFDTGGGGGACYGPGNERPIEDIIVEVIREDRTDKVLVAEGISAQGEDGSWFLSFRVPNLPPGNYFISAKERDSTEGGTQLGLRVSPDAPTWP